jgi:alcohol dehydrogenase class IV
VIQLFRHISCNINVSANSKIFIAAVSNLSDQIEIPNSVTLNGVKQEITGNIAKKVIADSVTSNNPILPSKSEVLGILSSRL